MGTACSFTQALAMVFQKKPVMIAADCAGMIARTGVHLAFRNREVFFWESP